MLIIKMIRYLLLVLALTAAESYAFVRMPFDTAEKPATK